MSWPFGVRAYLVPVLAAGLALQAAVSAPQAAAAEATSLQTMVEADWAAQEQRKGRQTGAPEAIREALSRADRLLEDLRRMPGAPDLHSEAAALERLRWQVDQIESLDEAARGDLYRRLRSVTREMALKNPLLASKPVVFLKRRRFICQMLHEYIGYYYNYADVAGGGVYVLEQPGRSLQLRDLVAGRLPRGNYATLTVSYDAKTVYFAFAETRPFDRRYPLRAEWTILPAADRVPKELNYYGPGRSSFHIFAVDADGQNLRQLTEGLEDDFDPCPLPDGDVAFMSSRRGGFCRCDNPFEPIPTHTLHRMDPSGKNVQVLSLHETNEWHPAVLNDGRIVYCRWDYVDRSAAHFHGLWVSNPDGSNPAILFGNYTMRISTCFQPRAIPGSNRIAFIAGAHHANVGGSLVLFDPTRTRLDPDTGEDRFESLERLTPEVCFPETPDCWPKSYFASPCPLSENYYLVAFSFEPLPGMGSGVKRDTETGIYYFDRFGNLELLYRDPGICSMDAAPLAPRTPPPVVPSALDPRLGDQGEFILSNVTWSLLPFPGARPIRELRVFQVLPKQATHIANQPRIGYANAESARMLLGTVPVEADGSAYFRAPARKPLYFQAVDDKGRAVQIMRSVTYLQPGERRGCVGCHERPGTPPPPQQLLATTRPPSEIQPGPDGTRPLSYPRLIQPVLDRHCVACHDGTEGPRKSPLVLTGEPAGSFTRSYESLRPYVRWYEWGGASITQTVTRPGRGGADESPLSKILDDPTHAEHVKLPEADRLRFYVWLDGNAPFYGTYRPAAQAAQRSGEPVSPPELQ